MKLKRTISVLMASCLALSMSYIPLNNTNIDYAMAEAKTEDVTVTVYSYRDTTYQNSDIELPEPYVLVDKWTEYTEEYGEWSDWSRDAVSSSDTREVNTDIIQNPTGYVMVNYRTRGNPDTVDNDCYRVTGLSVNVRTEPNTGSQSLGKTVDRSTVFKADGYSGNWIHAKSIHTSGGVVSGWISGNYCTPSGDTYVQYRNYSVNGDYGSYDLNANWGEYGGNEWVIDPGTFSSLRTVAPWEFVTGLRVNDGSYNVEGYNMTDQTGYVLDDGYASMVWFLNRVNYSNETWYRYRDRKTKTVYRYSVTDDWSEWSETPVEAIDEPDFKREVATDTITKQEEVQKDDISYGSNENYTFGVDDYSFLNSSKYFNNDYYHISDEYKKIYENLDNKHYESIKNRTQIKSGEKDKWSGSCYGLACLEILVKSGKISPESVYSEAESLYQIPVPKENEEVESLINFYHLQQFTEYGEKKLSAIAGITSAEERVNLAIAAAEKAQESGKPALLVFDYSKNKSSNSMEAHAVVIFGIEHGEFPIASSGVTYDSRILISDSNTFGFNDECCMYFDSETHEWEIPYYNKGMDYCNSSKKGKEKTAQIKYVTDDTDFMDFMHLSEKLPDTDEPSYANISINSAASDIGEISYYGESTGGINAAEEVELIYHGGAIGDTSDAEEDKETVNALLLNTEASYEYDSKGISDFETVLDYPESRLEADVTNGSFAVYVPDKSVSFEGKNSSYNLSMILNEGYHPTDWYKIEVSGDKADTGEITVTDEGYVFKSDSLKNGVSIEVSNKESKANLDLYTVSDEILIYQLSEYRIGIKLDTDNDGIFETKYTPSYLGDANNDNIVSIADAVRLQKYLLNEESIEKKEHIALDINMDGMVDVFDFILMRKKIIND